MELLTVLRTLQKEDEKEIVKSVEEFKSTFSYSPKKTKDVVHTFLQNIALIFAIKEERRSKLDQLMTHVLYNSLFEEKTDNEFKNVTMHIKAIQFALTDGSKESMIMIHKLWNGCSIMKKLALLNMGKTALGTRVTEKIEYIKLALDLYNEQHDCVNVIIENEILRGIISFEQGNDPLLCSCIEEMSRQKTNAKFLTILQQMNVLGDSLDRKITGRLILLSGEDHLYKDWIKSIVMTNPIHQFTELFYKSINSQDKIMWIKWSLAKSSLLRRIKLVEWGIVDHLHEIFLQMTIAPEISTLKLFHFLKALELLTCDIVANIDTLWSSVSSRLKPIMESTLLKSITLEICESCSNILKVCSPAQSRADGLFILQNLKSIFDADHHDFSLRTVYIIRNVSSYASIPNWFVTSWRQYIQNKTNRCHYDEGYMTCVKLFVEIANHTQIMELLNNTMLGLYQITPNLYRIINSSIILVECYSQSDALTQHGILMALNKIRERGQGESYIHFIVASSILQLCPEIITSQLEYLYCMEHIEILKEWPGVRSMINISIQHLKIEMLRFNKNAYTSIVSLTDSLKSIQLTEFMFKNGLMKRKNITEMFLTDMDTCKFISRVRLTDDIHIQNVLQWIDGRLGASLLTSDLYEPLMHLTAVLVDKYHMQFKGLGRKWFSLLNLNMISKPSNINDILKSYTLLTDHQPEVTVGQDAACLLNHGIFGYYIANATLNI